MTFKGDLKIPVICGACLIIRSLKILSKIFLVWPHKLTLHNLCLHVPGIFPSNLISGL